MSVKQPDVDLSNTNLMEKGVIHEPHIHIRQILVMQLNHFPHENLKPRKPVNFQHSQTIHQAHITGCPLRNLPVLVNQQNLFSLPVGKIQLLAKFSSQKKT